MLNYMSTAVGNKRFFFGNDRHPKRQGELRIADAVCSDPIKMRPAIAGGQAFARP